VIRFSCPACNRVVEVSDEDGGRKMNCPGCGQRLEVPAPDKAVLGKLEPGGGGPESARPRLSATAEADKGLAAIDDCPECGKALQVPEEDVGRRVACPRCAHVFVARRLSARGRDDDRAGRRRDRDDDRRDRGRGSGGRYCPECGAAVSRRDRRCPECDALQPERDDPALKDAASKKLAAGLCAILIGSLGVHKFVLGYNTAGIIMLLVSLLTCGIGAPVMHVISIVEGITYLTRSDEDFYRTYVVGKKEWF
jgi:TM2 domain-containing membrane protein YozV/DNA-directed RNA polymerase subunit M/transcription elongation factor TFIIS